MTDDFTITFLGHNSFLIGTSEDSVLVDPLLLPRYGEEYSMSPVELYPPRTITYDEMPVPSAVIISHEHSDHFHLPSLHKLPRTVPICVGPLMIEAVVECIAHLGFTVRRLSFGTPEDFGSVRVTLYPAAPETVLWESRVTQVHAQDARTGDAGVYLCVDALLSEHFIEELRAGLVAPPRVVAVSNNAQVTPPGVFGSLDNMRSPNRFEGTGQRGAFPGLSILHEVLVSYFTDVPELSECDLLICGGGFLKDYDEMGPFPFSEQHVLADVAAALTSGINVVGPLPGEVMTIRDSGIETVGWADWIAVDEQRFQELQDRRASFLRSNACIAMKAVSPPMTEDEVAIARQKVENELPLLARAILMSDLGRDLLKVGPPAARCPMLVKFLAQDSSIDFVLDVVEAEFREVGPTPIDDTIERYPYGAVLHLGDFWAVLEGRVQIWDLAGVGMRTWYRGDSMNSLVALLYCLYGEQAQPERACATYRKQLEIINGGAR